MMKLEDGSYGPDRPQLSREVLLSDLPLMFRGLYLWKGDPDGAGNPAEVICVHKNSIVYDAWPEHEYLCALNDHPPEEATHSGCGLYWIGDPIEAQHNADRGEG